MPISTVIHLIPTSDAIVRPTMGRLAHAAFLSILQRGNREKAEAVHALSGQKPFTVSPLIGKSEPYGPNRLFRAGTECWLRFTFLDDELFAGFGNAFLTQPSPSIRLGGATFQLSHLISSNTEIDGWSGNATYEQLLSSTQIDTRIRLRFYSPTAFRQMAPPGRKTRNQPTIDLVRCYQSWVNKWNAFAPLSIHKQKLLPFIEAHAGLTRIETETKMLDFGRHKEIGFIGACTYEFHGDWGGWDDKSESETPSPTIDVDLLRQANLLADFAFYCGTGYKTTMGMGQTRRI